MFIGKCIVYFLIDEKLCIITDNKIAAAGGLVKSARRGYFRKAL